MNAKVESTEYRFDGLKWVLVILLVAAGVVGNSYFSELSLLYRVPALLGIALVALLISAFTAKGASILTLLRESVVEGRKVVWPTPAETHQTTLIVVLVVLLMAMILWGLDSLLGWIAALILG